MTVRILIGDCRERMAELDADSIDSCVTDPPYHLTSIVKRFGAVGKTGAYARASRGFMGQTWDGGDVAFQPETWEAVYRVLKPGAHLVAFSGTRTYHRMACAIEDAGFEIRDQLAWIYGSGFPKSHDAAQSVEKLLTTGKARREDRDLGGMSRNRFSGSTEGRLIADTGGKVALTTPEALAVEGWGTALKPAWEPIVLARKPLVGTVANNVLKHGTGALNIDGCRIATSEIAEADRQRNSMGYRGGNDSSARHAGSGTNCVLGRWPANIIHDGSEEVLAGFPETEARGNIGATKHGKAIFGSCEPMEGGFYASDSGSAARFFYCAKATTEERGEGNNHPTVKPVDLMRWLVRLITPKGGTVLDPFSGSGSTLIAADAEQFNAIGCELSPDYVAIAERRVRAAAGMFAEVFIGAAA